MKKHLIASLALMSALAAQAQTHQFDIQAQKLGAPVQSTMYGIFFEDINFAADGGLYAELVKNRSFEFPYALQGWKPSGKVEVRTDSPAYDRCPHYARLSYSGHKEHWTALDNEGFFGMGVTKDNEYRFTVTARAPQGKAKIRVQLVNTRSMGENHFLSSPRQVQDIEITSADWQKYTITLKPNETCERANLRILLVGDQTADLDHISLFPKDTFNGHENGLRKDLAQALADLHPGIFRFPGGCIVEGTTLEERYNWKNSVGPVENRPLNQNRWLDTFPYRLYPDYYQSYGLGFFEFFQLSEEIGSEPLPIISCGLACQFQNDDMSAHQPVEELDCFVQDALDLIEFANGDVTTTWGKVRADMGHPAPFNLKYLGVGNEQWGPEYPEHLKPFVEAIRKAHPEIKLVGSAGPNSEGDQFDYLWPEMTKLGADLVDEHFYRPADWFLKQGNRYDNYDRKGPKVFAGEYACHIAGKKYNHYYPALLEAAFMTGLERNADIVHMATYAPLFAHVEGWQWRPDMIWYDNLRVARTCSYYVQQLYATHKGTNVLDLKMNGKPVAGNDDQDGLFASAVYDANTGEYIVKVANTQAKPQQLKLNFTLKKKQAPLSSGKVIELTSQDMQLENTVDNPNAVKPAEKPVNVTGNVLDVQIPASSFQVYILK